MGEADTVEEAAKKLCAHAFGERVYRSQLKNYDFGITNEGLDARQRFISYKFRQGDLVEVRAAPKAGGNMIYKMLEVVYSPITAREEQQRALFKTGWLKKQGLKTKTWKKRWFVLDMEKLQVRVPGCAWATDGLVLGGREDEEGAWHHVPRRV